MKKIVKDIDLAVHLHSEIEEEEFEDTSNEEIEKIVESVIKSDLLDNDSTVSAQVMSHMTSTIESEKENDKTN